MARTLVQHPDESRQHNRVTAFTLCQQCCQLLIRRQRAPGGYRLWCIVGGRRWLNGLSFRVVFTLHLAEVQADANTNQEHDAKNDRSQ